jgi:hypothetical protein
VKGRIGLTDMRNPNTVEVTYRDLQEKVSKILTERGAKGERLVFSMFDEANNESDDEWKVIIPDFNSVFCEGKARFTEPYYGFKSKTVRNPTWSDVIYLANESILAGMKKENLDGWDHVFLENVKLKKEVGGVKVFEFWFGS